ncbi:sulfatase [Verrucomicrobiota bacterium]
MNRRDFMRVSALAGVAILSPDLLLAETSSGKRPNIIFLLADDQCSYSVGCYGNEAMKTPNMDKLGYDGVIFDNHYDTTSICMGSRANIMSGMYEYKNGCNFNKGSFSGENWLRSYPVLLRDAGYFTGFAGKLGLGGNMNSADPGGAQASRFDVWGGGPGQTFYQTEKNKSMVKYAEKYPHSTLSYAAFSQDFIKQAVKQDKPFCLSISFKAPHQPHSPDPSFDDVYKDAAFKKPDNYGHEHGEHLSKQSKSGRQWGGSSSKMSHERYTDKWRQYHQLIYGIDVALGMIREELERSGVADNTVIIYTSDNGYSCGSHGFSGKVLPYEEPARVPLMIYDPRHAVSGQKKRCKALTGNVDFAPTILKLAGLPVPENMDGKDLLPLLDNPQSDIRDNMIIMNTYGAVPTCYLAVVTKQWKYNYWWYAGEGMKPVEELFDTENDPLEMKNLAAEPEHEKTLNMMREKYDAQLDLLKKGAVSDYKKYGNLFDRHIPWSEKEVELGGRKKKK